MKISEARENVLYNHLRTVPSGAMDIANAAIACLPYSALKKLVEALELEPKVTIEQKRKA